MTLAYKVMVNETRERKSGEREKMWNREMPPDLTDYRLDIIYCQISPLSQIMSHLEKKHILFRNMTADNMLDGRALLDVSLEVGKVAECRICLRYVINML